MSCGTYCVFNFYVPMRFSDMAGDDKVVTYRAINMNTKVLVSETLSQNFFFTKMREKLTVMNATHCNLCIFVLAKPQLGTLEYFI